METWVAPGLEVVDEVVVDDVVVDVLVSAVVVDVLVSAVAAVVAVVVVVVVGQSTDASIVRPSLLPNAQ